MKLIGTPPSQKEIVFEGGIGTKLHINILILLQINPNQLTHPDPAMFDIRKYFKKKVYISNA